MEQQKQETTCKECGCEISPNESFGMCEPCCEVYFDKLG
jgi:hypothetical protein